MSQYAPISLYDSTGIRKYLNTSERKLFYKTVNQLHNEQKSLFLLLIFWTGVRISEALSTTKNSIDFEDQVLIVRSLKKRDKIVYRRIPLPPQLIARLENLPNPNDHGFRLFPWSRRTASRYIMSIMKECNIRGSKACAKGLRHSFAVHCINHNIPITMLQKWMGHSHLSTTSIYLDIIGEEERELARRIWERL